MNLRTGEPSDRWTFGQMNLRTGKPSDRWTFGQMNLRTDEPSDRWTFGQIDWNRLYRLDILCKYQNRNQEVKPAYKFINFVIKTKYDNRMATMMIWLKGLLALTHAISLKTNRHLIFSVWSDQERQRFLSPHIIYWQKKKMIIWGWIAVAPRWSKYAEAQITT